MILSFLHHQLHELPLWGVAATAISVLAQDVTEDVVGAAVQVPVWILLVLIYVGSAISGVAHMYWKGDAQPLGKWIAAGITCGFLGVGVAMILYARYSGNILFLAGVSLFAGMGSSFTIDLLKNLAKMWVARFSPKSADKEQ